MTATPDQSAASTATTKAGDVAPRHFHRLPQLDGLRAIAVLIVFVSHCGLERFVPGGFGVTIFFFLSGYLITSLLRNEVADTGRIDLGAFYLRRTYRIWPPLWLTMLLLIGLGILVGRPPDWVGIAEQLGFVSNYAFLWGHADRGVPDIPLWSLAVEEHFYLVFPGIYALWLGRLEPARAAAVCLAACLLVLAIRIYCVLTVDDIGGIYYWTHTRIDSILFGSCLALWRNPAMDPDVRRPPMWQVGVALLVLLACLLIRNEIFRQTLRYSLQGASLLVLFSYVLTTDNPLVRVLSSIPMRKIGLYSYTLYLVHKPLVAMLTERWPDTPVPVVMLVVGTASWLWAAAMYAAVERHFARLRKRTGPHPA